MPSSGIGQATLTFPASAQAARYRSSVVVTDTAPQPDPNPYGTSPFTLAAASSWRKGDVGNGLFVTVSQNNTDTLVIDSGGISTVNVGALSAGSNWGRVTFGNGLFVTSCTTSGGLIARSSDGVNWNTVAPPAGLDQTAHILYLNGRFAYLRFSAPSYVYTSTDAVTWTQNVSLGTSAISGNRWASDGTTLVACNGFGNTLYWTDLTQPPGGTSSGTPANVVPGVTYTRGMFVVLTGTGAVYTSVNGVTGWGNAIPGIQNPPGVTISWVDIHTYKGVTIAHGYSASDQYFAVLSVDSTYWDVRLYRSGISAGSLIATAGRYLLPTDGTSAAESLWVSQVYPNTRTVSTANTLVKPAAPVPGSNIASVTITGLADITSASSASAFIDGSDTTADRNGYEHESADIRLSCDNFVPGVGFTINAISDARLDGAVKVRYVWRT